VGVALVVLYVACGVCCSGTLALNQSTSDAPTHPTHTHLTPTDDDDDSDDVSLVNSDDLSNDSDGAGGGMEEDDEEDDDE